MVRELTVSECRHTWRGGGLELVKCCLLSVGDVHQMSGCAMRSSQMHAKDWLSIRPCDGVGQEWRLAADKKTKEAVQHSAALQAELEKKTKQIENLEVQMHMHHGCHSCALTAARPSLTLTDSVRC